MRSSAPGIFPTWLSNTCSCNGIFESLRRYGAKEAVLVAWGVDTNGRKHLLHLAVGNKESKDCWTGFFRHMVGRGQAPL